MKKIKIFVSHRIDLEAETIKNPLYENIRCGAVFDSFSSDSRLKGDNSGDNISELRTELGEFTVQYWAWKNVDADYYGLCHYRRYLSFANDYIPTTHFQGFIVEDHISPKNCSKYNLLSYRKMRREIMKYDVITSQKYNVDNNTLIYPIPKTESELWMNHPKILILPADLDYLKQLVKEDYPHYYDSLLDELSSTQHRGFNCFVMEKKLFYKMCEFEFDILFKLKDYLDNDKLKRGGAAVRELGYMGEILYGTFMNYIFKQNNIKKCEKQLIFFRNPEKSHDSFFKKTYNALKTVMKTVLPAYRVSIRIEQQNSILSATQINTIQQIGEIKKSIQELKNDLVAITSLEKFQMWCSTPTVPSDIIEVKKQFWKSFPKADGELRLIQKANLLLLAELKKICDSTGICFWLHGGSLVGGLRHSGFVPWDDDIDIGMMRNDFRMLKQALSDTRFEIAEYYYPAIGCRSYRFMPKDSEGLFFVDIFLYDYILLETESLGSQWIKLKYFKTNLTKQMIDAASASGEKRNNIRIDSFPELKSELDNILDTYIERFESKKNTEYISWGIDNNYENPTRYAWHHGRIFSSSDIFPLKEIIFENKTMYAPANFEKYVFSEYGIDYLEMPNDIGTSKHIQEYFGEKNISESYDRFIDLIKNN